MPVAAPRLRRILLTKLSLEELAKKRHECYALIADGKIIARTYMSRGHDDISDKLLRQMAEELNVGLREFKRAIDCTLDAETFARIVIAGSRSNG
jgi:Uma2 family endonuclease